MQAAATRGKEHGRVERRAITTSTWVNEYLADWPGVAQVFRVARERTVKGVTTTQVVYGLSSLGRGAADAGRLLALCRAHWGIENGRHHTRDETFREDRCRVRRGHAPRVLASLRNVAVHLLRKTDHPSVPAATREMAAFPDRDLAMLNHPPSISESPWRGNTWNCNVRHLTVEWCGMLSDLSDYVSRLKRKRRRPRWAGGGPLRPARGGSTCWSSSAFQQHLSATLSRTPTGKVSFTRTPRRSSPVGHHPVAPLVGRTPAPGGRSGGGRRAPVTCRTASRTARRTRERTDRRRGGRWHRPHPIAHSR